MRLKNQGTIIVLERETRLGFVYNQIEEKNDFLKRKHSGSRIFFKINVALHYHCLVLKKALFYFASLG